MNSCYEVELRGCTPDPLMAYLKALGIFRLVSEQKDSSARAWWQGDTFFLRSALDREGLVDFFLNEYRPTPIASPWNNRYKTGVMKGDKAGLDVILASPDKRFSDYACTILLTKQIIEKEEEKERILKRCRTLFSDKALEWPDAVFVLTKGKPKYPPLTSNGGTLGTSSSGDISMNFAKNLVSALGLGKPQRKDSDKSALNWIETSLFGGTSPALKNPGGQFNPGGWGPNSTNGFEGDSLINPWDFVLMVEGMLAFAGAPARRLSPESQNKAVSPFTVDMSAAGYSTPTSSEYGSSARAEFWAPLWERPTTMKEFLHIAMEGRAQLGRRQASNGVGFVRAIAGLGVERGISSFQRFGFLQRTGIDGVFAAAIGKFVTQEQPVANVLFDLDRWLDRLRSQARGNKAPAGLGLMLSQLDNAILEFCQRGWPEDLQNVLIAVGHAELWLSKSSLSRDSDRNAGIRPLDSLSQSWVPHANDGSSAFRLARSMASILDESGREEKKVRIGAVREHMFPVDTENRAAWKKNSNSFVWTAGDPLDNMLAVLERRCLEGRMQNWSYAPLSSAYSASLTDIVAFLNGDVEPQRVADLALPLSIVYYRHRINRGIDPAPSDLPAAYAVMKMTLLPKNTLLSKNFVCREFNVETDIGMEPRMLSMLRAGRVNDAYQVACRRLKASGLQPLTDKPGIANGSELGRRLAAALLFPLDENAHCALAQRAIRKPQQPETQNS